MTNIDIKNNLIIFIKNENNMFNEDFLELIDNLNKTYLDFKTPNLIKYYFDDKKSFIFELNKIVKDYFDYFNKDEIKYIEIKESFNLLNFKHNINLFNKESLEILCELYKNYKLYFK